MHEGGCVRVGAGVGGCMRVGAGVGGCMGVVHVGGGGAGVVGFMQDGECRFCCYHNSNCFRNKR